MRDVEHGVQTVRDGFNGHSTHGWTELSELLEGGAGAAEALDRATPNPKRNGDPLGLLSRQGQAPSTTQQPSWLRPVDDSDNGPLYRRIAAEGFDLARGCVTAIQGPPRRGKTPLMFQLLYCVANGNPFLGV